MLVHTSHVDYIACGRVLALLMAVTAPSVTGSLQLRRMQRERSLKNVN